MRLGRARGLRPGRRGERFFLSHRPLTVLLSLLIDPGCFRIEEGETRIALRVADAGGVPASYRVHFQAAGDTWQPANEGPFRSEATFDIPESAPALYVEVNPGSLTCARLAAAGTIEAIFN